MGVEGLLKTLWKMLITLNIIPGLLKNHCKRRSRRFLFRFLFGIQKGSGVWGKAPNTPYRNQTASKCRALLS